ncbi:MAG: PQQ-binding-like beta-propeller repeat protein [Sedimentisphaerales bacterium]
MNRSVCRLLRIGLYVCLIVVPALVGSASEAGVSAKVITTSSGFTGGICVVLGSKDGDLAAALSQRGRFIVQVLVPEKALLDKIRASLRSTGLYGPVSADLSDGDRLPYAENLINLVVVKDNADVVKQEFGVNEVFRVLAPLGEVYFAGASESLREELSQAGFTEIVWLADAGGWLKAIKPWPKEIDEWTHYLHGADGNPVAEDRVVAPPKHYQWVSDPLWMRSHESDSSVRTLVTSRGRLFYIGDDAPISLVGDHDLPDKWFLTAQDAFNGVLLWKVPIKDWGWRAWKPSWFAPRPGDIPLNIEKRLVAVEDKVYVTLGYRAPVSQLDAKSGKVLRTYDNTARTAEILHRDGLLILSVLEGDSARVKLVDAKSGKLRWSSEKAYTGTTTDYYRFRAMHGSVTPAKVDPTLNIATDGDVIALLDGEDVLGLDFDSGKERWRGRFPLVKADYKAGGISALQTVWTGTLIVRDGVVVHASPNQLAAFSAQSGRILWTQPKKYLGHLWYEWKDVFIIDGLVWTWSSQTARGPLLVNGRASKTNSTWPVSANGYDLHSGRLARQVPLGNIFKTYHHHRCYRDKATPRYILASRRGSEYVDLEQGNHTIQNWVRGTCHVGMMPANGLQYAPPHPCVCYIEEKINGMTALAPQVPPRYRPTTDAENHPLERGPAFGQVHGADPADGDWPAYRHDSLRSGSVKTNVPVAPQLLWHKKVGKKLAPPAIVGGRMFVPLVDEHSLVALNVSGGERIWEATTGGRIDSPPTYYRGTVIFGSAGGWVYCLRADDGELVWRFRAAPEDRGIGAFGQLESAWPVHGSVLVQDGTAYFVAGRSSHLDGGLYLYGLDATTGRIRHQARLEGPDYDVSNISQNYQLPMGALPDILQGDGELIYMRNLTFNANLKEQRVPPKKATIRVFTKSSLLDDSYFKRTPWTYGQSGYARLIVHDDKTAYCVRMFDSLQGLNPSVYFTPGNKGGVLAAIDQSDGSRLWECRLDAPTVFNGIAAASGRLYLTMQDGEVVCFGR